MYRLECNVTALFDDHWKIRLRIRNFLPLKPEDLRFQLRQVLNCLQNENKKRKTRIFRIF